MNVALGARKALTLAGITMDDMQHFQQVLVDSGKSPKTVNLEFGVVRKAFEDAH